MKRFAYRQLLAWKNSPRRKPLVLRGARQVGKTWLLHSFAEREYASAVSLDFEQDPGLRDLFEGQLSADHILRNLSLYTRQDIDPDTTLIVFDEVQACDAALNSLKYFREQRPDIHIVAAGSLLGIRLSGSRSFPVGKVSFLDLHPMTFLEFLDAHEEQGLHTLIAEADVPEPFPEALHRRLVDLLRRYVFVGGMPEAVAHHREHRDVHVVRTIQTEILRAYHADFAKYAPGPDIPKLSLIWESIPRHLAKENRKFMFSAVRSGARARTYESAIAWLADAGLILRAFRVDAPRCPLKAYADPSVFKVYALDVGLLGALAGLSPRALAEGVRVFEEFNGALTENLVAQELNSRGGDTRLVYWSSSSLAEVDFLHEHDGDVYPLEVKAGINPRSKSLRSYDKRYSPRTLSRASLLNLSQDGRICNYPLYALARFPYLGREGTGA